jgi:hypothetical protein
VVSLLPELARGQYQAGTTTDRWTNAPSSTTAVVEETGTDLPVELIARGSARVAAALLVPTPRKFLRPEGLRRRSPRSVELPLERKPKVARQLLHLVSYSRHFLFGSYAGVFPVYLSS